MYTDWAWYNKKLFKCIQYTVMLFTFVFPLILTAANQPAPDNNIEHFGATLEHVKKYYVKDLKDNQLFEQAMQGLLAKLDPHSAYLNEKDMKELMNATQGQFSGVGIEVSAAEDGYIKVITPLDGSPAAKAGIQPGDTIIKINSTLVKDIPINQVIDKLRGPKGSKVEITVLRNNQTQPVQYKLTREDIHLLSVKYRVYEKNYGYIRISQFQTSTAADFRNAIADLKLKTHNDLRGLLLDLRNNPGGLLDAAVKVADDVLDTHKDGKQGLIVYTKGRAPGSNFTAKITPGDLLKNIPIVVLINQGSASAAEIVAGALQDNHRAVIIGTPSFGKGSVQSIIPIDDTSAVKLTTAIYYTPAGKEIQARGIQPDIVIDSVKVENKPEKESINFTETSLTGYLKNDSKNDSAATTLVPSDKLIYKDFHIHQALNILKGLYALSQQKI